VDIATGKDDRAILQKMIEVTWYRQPADAG